MVDSVSGQAFDRAESLRDYSYNVETAYAESNGLYLVDLLNIK